MPEGETFNPNLLIFFSAEMTPPIRGFLQSPQAREIQAGSLEFIRNHKITTLNDFELPAMEKFRSSFNGKVFEEIAFRYLDESMKREGLVLLSPAEVFNLYAKLHKGKMIIRDFGLQQGIKGISIPDGLILQKVNNGWHIVGTSEYRLGEGTEKIEKQAKRFSNARFLRQNLLLGDQDSRLKIGGIIIGLFSM